MTFGERLRSARKAAGLTQQELAHDSAVSLMSIRRYEKNERSPRLAECLRLADALHIFDAIEQRAFIYGESDEDAAKRLWESITGRKAETIEIKDDRELSPIMEQIRDSLVRLNASGQEEAVKRVRELTEIPRFQNPDFEEYISP